MSWLDVQGGAVCQSGWGSCQVGTSRRGSFWTVFLDCLIRCRSGGWLDAIADRQEGGACLEVESRVGGMPGVTSRCQGCPGGPLSPDGLVR